MRFHGGQPPVSALLDFWSALSLSNLRASAPGAAYSSGMPPLMRLGYGAVAALTLLLPACSQDTTPNPTPTPVQPCPWGVPPEMVRSCGVMDVPLKQDQPQGPSVQLPYVVFRGSAYQSPGYATVVLQGGPGGASAYIAYYMADFMSQAKPYGDVIVFDQRGAGNSQPNLACPLSPTLALLDPPAFRAQVQKCLNDFQGRGIPLADFNTRASADDVAFMARKLGYARVNLYGMSYGTQLAQEVVRRHPGLVRAQVLDGVLDPAQSWAATQTRLLHDTLVRFGAACAAAGHCPAGADLPAQVQQAADTLDRLHLTVDGQDFGSTGLLPINGDLLLATVSSYGYSPDGLMQFPPLLQGVQDHNLRVIAQTISPAARLWTDLSLGMFMTVACQDNATDAGSIEAAHAGLPPVFARRAALYKAFAEACTQMGLTTAPDALTPVSAHVPTLLISGRWDAVTPPVLAEAVAPRFHPSQHVIFENGGHVNGFTDLCGAQMLVTFLNDPGAPLSTSCANQPLNWPPVTPLTSP